MAGTSLSDALEGSQASDTDHGYSTDNYPMLDIALPEYEPTVNSSERIVGEDHSQITPALPERKESTGGRNEESSKRITIEIAGNGKIDVTGGINKDKVIDLLQENLKPVLMSILQSEMYEEGEQSYDY
jgi:hypothetical protein